MKHSKYYKLTFIFVLTMINYSIAQNCKCDSVIENRNSNWNKWVDNSDTIKILKIVKIGIIKTEKEKEKLLTRLTKDTAWVAFPVSGKTVTVKLGRFDTLQGKQFSLPDKIEKYDSTKGKPFLLPGETIPMRTVSFASKKQSLDQLYEDVALGDEYYEVYFINGKTEFMSPTICAKRYCTIIDNIFFNLFIKK